MEQGTKSLKNDSYYLLFFGIHLKFVTDLFTTSLRGFHIDRSGFHFRLIEK